MSGAIALTGGMGMGKSTVAKMFVARGCLHYDADAAVAQMYGWRELPRGRGPGSGADAEAVKFLQGILPTGVIRFDSSWNGFVVDRPSLLAAIEADPTLLDRIEEAFAKPFWSNLKGWLTAQDLLASKPIRLLDVPLWFETRCPIYDLSNLADATKGNDQIAQVMEKTSLPLSTWMEKAFSKELLTVVVSCPRELQLERCMARPGMTLEKFEFLTSRQMSDAEKRERADWIIDTSGTLEEVSNTVDRIMVEMKLRGHG
jgi:dephospho-CoA kinase